jgi:hypothetical protein
MLSQIAAVDHVDLPPEGTGTVRAISRIGYTLEEALADLIDNSVDAEANNVEITFFRNDRELTAVAIADDGRGMTTEQLHQGMRFAGRTDQKPEELATYGFGMKSASLSQCKTLTVVTRKAGSTSACRWARESIGKDWRCEILDSGAAAHLFSSAGVRTRSAVSGTLVIWDRLDRLSVGEGELDEFVSGQIPALELHLGLVFHRFLRSGHLKITIAVKHEQRSLALPRLVRPLDPFGYDASGDRRYPKTFKTMLPGTGALALIAHIWPPKSVDPHFLLGSRTGAQWQGIYAYRNDRLIQAGGWNKVVRNNTDAELKQARISIELPPGGIDVNVQKSKLEVSAAQAQALLKAKSDDGKTLADFLEDARRAYRAGKRARMPTATATLVPGQGVPAPLRRRALKELAPRGQVHEVEFSWETLPEGQLFELDPGEDRIILNKLYRKAVLSGSAASGADAPLVKMLLFLLFKEDLKLLRLRQKRREWVEMCNRLLLKALS